MALFEAHVSLFQDPRPAEVQGMERLSRRKPFGNISIQQTLDEFASTQRGSQTYHDALCLCFCCWRYLCVFVYLCICMYLVMCMCIYICSHMYICNIDTQNKLLPFMVSCMGFKGALRRFDSGCCNVSARMFVSTRGISMYFLTWPIKVG